MVKAMGKDTVTVEVMVKVMGTGTGKGMDRPLRQKKWRRRGTSSSLMPWWRHRGLRLELIHCDLCEVT